MDEDGYLAHDAAAHRIYERLKVLALSLGRVEIRASRSQIGFYRAHPFAAVWKPAQYLKGDRPPLVLTIFLRRRDRSPRWKEVVEPSAGRFTHHLELRAVSDIDAEVEGWLTEAWSAAG